MMNLLYVGKGCRIMNDVKSAILFYGKTRIPLPFAEYKKYDVGTGYVALYDCDEDCCLLCRCLDESEISYYGDNISRLVIKNGKEEELKTNIKIKEISVIIITSKLKTIEQADNIIDSYKKAIDKFDDIDGDN